MSVAIDLHIIGSQEDKLFHEGLKAHEIYTSPNAGLQVVVIDSYHADRLMTYNKMALAENQPFLLVKATGDFLCVGPLIERGQNACLCCLIDQLAGMRVDERLSSRRIGRQIQIPHAMIATAGIEAKSALINEVASLVHSWYSDTVKPGATVVSFDAWTGSREVHDVRKRPQCRMCGQPADKPHAVSLSSRIASNRLDGGFRSIAPASTLEQMAVHLDTLTGIVHELRPLFQLPEGQAFIYGATFTTPSSGGEPIFKVSYGKGMTEAQARASALCEALEIYSRTYQGYEYTINSTYAELKDAVHPRSYLHYSEAQYAKREMLNASIYAVTDHIPEPFEEQTEISWTPLWSLTFEHFKYLPTAYCYDRATDAGRRFCACDSNGHAAGNNLEEAILQGFLELVERDGIALWWYNRASMPGVSLKSFADTFLDDAVHYLASIGRDLVVLDITTDLGIPTFVAVSTQCATNIERQIVLGFGAHLDARLGIQRAVTELFQRLFVALAVERKEVPATEVYNEAQLYWWDHVTLGNQPYLVPSDAKQVQTSACYKVVEENDIANLLMQCVDIASCSGIELLVLDQTRPDIGLHTAKVVAPGLRHQKRRLAPGRLYDVPERLGWIQQVHASNQLNPLSMMF